jgi:hypothetical protein
MPFTVTVYKERNGAWTDEVADTFVVPGEVTGFETGVEGDEMVFVMADGSKINAIDIR